MKRLLGALAGLAASLAATAFAPTAHAHDDLEYVTRFRFGINAAGGGLAGDHEAGMGGGQLRLGAQINDLFAIYYQGEGFIGAWSTDSRLAGMLYNVAMAELTLADVFQLGLGPSLDYVWGCRDPNGNRDLACANEGPFFGADARLAVVLGGEGPHNRHGVTFSATIHPTWFAEDSVSVAALLGVGYEMY